MAEILKGMPVANRLTEETKKEAQSLRKEGIIPTLAIVRVGERPEDISYEKGAKKRAEESDISVKSILLPSDIEPGRFFDALREAARDESVHGILMLRPLPAHLDEEKARHCIPPEKDVDGCTDGSLAGVFTNTPLGFAPCTARAAMEILRHYKIPVSGKHAVVIGRSSVVGRPVAMMLLHENATVTICHTKTKDVAAMAGTADILIAASGNMESIDGSYLNKNQTIIDVGIGWNEEKQKLCGDVHFEAAEPVVKALTPVPGGVGSVTTAVLCRHVAEAARRAALR